MPDEPKADNTAAKINDLIRDHQVQANQFLNRLIEYDRNYRSEPQRKRREVFANTFVQETFRAVESVTSSLEAILFADSPWFEVEAKSNDPEQQEKALITQAVLEHQLHQSKFRTKFSRIIRSLVLNGTVVVETPWRFTTRMVAKGDSFVEKTLDDWPDIILQPLANVRFDPFAQDIEDAEWIAFENEVSQHELDDLIAAASKLTEEDIKAPVVTNATNELNIGLSVARQIRQERGYVRAKDDQKRIVVVDYWGKHPNPKPKDEATDERAPDETRNVIWRIITVNRTDTVLEISEHYDHGMKPALKSSLIDREGSFYGLGAGEIARRPQLELNDFRNLMRDISNFGLNNQWMRIGPGTTKVQKLKIAPNKIHDQPETGKLEPMKPDFNAITHGIRLEEMTKEDIRQSTGATATTQALPTGVTATETRVIASEAGRRLNGFAITIAETILRPYLLRMVELNKQFLDDKVLVKIAGKGSTIISKAAGKDDLLVDPEIKIRLASDLDFRPVMQRRLSSAIQTFGQTKEQLELENPGKEVRITPLVLKLGKTFGIDSREILVDKTPEPPPPPVPLAPAPQEGLPPEPAAPQGEPQPGTPEAQARARAIVQQVFADQQAAAGVVQ